MEQRAAKYEAVLFCNSFTVLGINNTDAEGRLVLADALCVASELKLDVIVGRQHFVDLVNSGER